jgi:hypothetical protein
MDPEGNSPAHFAARHGNVELLEELIYHDRPADMDHPNLRVRNGGAVAGD